MPKFSIITVNLNNAIGLKKTIESTITQKFSDFEYIIIDGASKDESLYVIQQFLDYRISWISEPDNGIYHAMNKGINIARGDFLLFINSGDILVNDAVLTSVNGLLKKDTDLCSGVLIIDDENKKDFIFPVDKLSLSYCFNAGLTHPNTFIRRSLFEKYGLYNEENKIASDWEFFLKVGGFHNINYQSIPLPISCFYLDGISSYPQNSVLLFECNQAIQKIVPAPILIDIERLNSLELKMREIHFYTLNYLFDKYPKLFKFFFFPLKVVYYLIKKQKK